ncbi:heat-inducible transcriptional repressor HrcA [Fictibacillus phosphorivorans]|uniref:Heat-inducible transcription repressor HrcA n=1 Tax=Fictibacillus phosphorivorans TaxID=1221500 RepID=A0A165P0F3_9BACL|nr:heat-inducible transcriptional repressor HrcA [Fictibacillus phosphorivorans]KZE68434.1 heat-inducible transcriptional repressor HrcA [Fictibacillus phosphorivorans]
MLTERQLFILRVLIDDYIKHVEPVGSRTISKREDITYSPATIRNELADLEDLGFLEKTHTSSGRIPSEKGYRFYVDHLLPSLFMEENEMGHSEFLFTEKVQEAEALFDQSAKILSDMTNYTSVVLGPNALDMKLKNMQIIPISAQMAVAIFVTNTGHVENRQIVLPDTIEPSDLEKLVNILNDRLAGVRLIELNTRIKKELSAVFKKHLRNDLNMGVFLDQLLLWSKKEKLFYGGKTNMLSQPEFRDLDKVRPLLDFLETRDLMEKLVSSTDKGLTIRIGTENEHEAMKNCSVINASYTMHGKHIGTISLIGPTRMEYKKVISLLDSLSKEMTNRLNGFSK